MSYTLKWKQHKAKALPLLKLIQTAGLATDPRAKNAAAGFAVLVTGRDGYVVAFSMAEITPEIGGRAVWLALDVDGQPLPENEAPARIVAPDDRAPTRWVFGVKTIHVVDGRRLAAPESR